MTGPLDLVRIERMTSALNARLVPLSRDHECRRAYSAAGIARYTEAEHGAAWEDAMLERCVLVAQRGLEHAHG